MLTCAKLVSEAVVEEVEIRRSVFLVHSRHQNTVDRESNTIASNQREINVEFLFPSAFSSQTVLVSMER